MLPPAVNPAGPDAEDEDADVGSSPVRRDGDGRARCSRRPGTGAVSAANERTTVLVAVSMTWTRPAAT